jgi:hypothetical protein
MGVVLNPTNNSTTKQQSSTSSEDNSSSKNYVRIVVDESIEKQIVLDELSVESVGTMTTDEMNNRNIAGREIPIIKINDYTISGPEISTLTLYVSERIPTLSLSLRTIGTQFRSSHMPKDGDICSVFIAPKTETLTSIRADFVITSAIPTETSKGTNIEIYGKLFIPGFDTDAIFGKVGTSKDVFIDCAKRYGLGFATDDQDNTTDKQLWICGGLPCEEFLNNTISHTWKDETSFYDWWIDQFYNINFINVNKIILANTGEVDLTALTSEVGGSYDTPQDYTQDNTKAGAKLLTNLPHLNMGSLMIKKWEIFNNSTEITFEDGVEIRSNEFKQNANIFTANENPITTLSNVPAYNQKLIEDHIVLRGRSEYSSETNPKSDSAKANYNYKDIYIKQPWSGISFVLSDDDEQTDDTMKWSGNVNKNYIRAAYHNRINLDELDKMYITVETDGLCTQIMRGEVVPVALKKNQISELTTAPSDQTGVAERFYNGFYYVDGIEFSYYYNPTREYRQYKTKFTLKRREWPIPVDYLSPNEAGE